MEKVRPPCSQPSDRGRLKSRTEQNIRPATINQRTNERRTNERMNEFAESSVVVFLSLLYFRFCSVLQPSSIRGLATPWTYFLHFSMSSVILIDSSTGSPVHVLMLSIHAVFQISTTLLLYVHAVYLYPCAANCAYSINE